MFGFIKNIHSQESRKLTALILAAFLITFFISRLTVYLVINRLLIDLFLTVGNVHIHHFSYGVVILALVGLSLILQIPSLTNRRLRWIAIWYGIGLGLTFDEFGMWIRLEDNYWIRQSYDAVVVVALLLLNIAYFKPLVKTLYERFWQEK